MAASIAFDYDGNPVTINTPLTLLAWKRVPVYVGPTTLFNYILGFSFNDGTTDLSLEMRIFTDTPAAMTYESANQGSLIEGIDIALCNSMYIRTMKNNEVYNSKASLQLIISSVTGVPDCSGTFDGDLVLYRGTPVINNSLPMLSNPSAVTDTITISNSSFTDIPII